MLHRRSARARKHKHNYIMRVRKVAWRQAMAYSWACPSFKTEFILAIASTSRSRLEIGRFRFRFPRSCSSNPLGLYSFADTGKSTTC